MVGKLFKSSFQWCKPYSIPSLLQIGMLILVKEYGSVKNGKK